MPISTTPTLTAGAQAGPYRIANVRAENGSAAEAIDTRSQERVAIKRLPGALAFDAAALAQYRQLVEAVNALGHPNILRGRGVEVFDDAAYLIAEFAPRGSLADAVRASGRLPWIEATRRMIEVCRTIEAAHAQGLVHGAIRPSNLLVTEKGAVQVSEFSGGIVPPRNADYSAPETIAAGGASIAADVYSLGATYFALLSGHAPFSEAANDASLAAAHANNPIPNVRAGQVHMPLRCEVIIRKAMAKLPAERYGSVQELRDELQIVARTEDVRTPPVAPMIRPPRRRWSVQGWLTPALFLLAIAAAAYFSLFRGTSKTKSKSDVPAVIARPMLRNYLDMAFIQPPVGEFAMGHALAGDAPPHVVRITKPFYIGVREVNQAEFHLVMGKKPSLFANVNAPVDSVTWDEAREFCERLSQFEAERRAGRSYRLPTEAEWEYCCRAGTRTHFAFGNTVGVQQANTRMSGLNRPTPAGMYPPNAWGLYEMHGNVWEWCADWYKSDYYRGSPVNDPTGPSSGIRRVARGGAFSSPPELCTSSHRCDRFDLSHRGPDVGFRIICLSPDLDTDGDGEKP